MEGVSRFPGIRYCQWHGCQAAVYHKGQFKVLVFIYTAAVAQSFANHGFLVLAFAADLQANTHSTPGEQDAVIPA